MNTQELVDKFANGTISDAERDALFATAESDPVLQDTLAELEKVDDLLNFTKSEESKRLFGYLNKVEATVLATMATSVPIAVSQSGWWYGAAGTVGGLAVAGAIWLATSSPAEHPVTPLKSPVISRQVPAEEKTVATNETPRATSAPSKIGTQQHRKTADNKHHAGIEAQRVTVNATSGGTNDIAPELQNILADIAEGKSNPAVSADNHFKAAMLYKEMKNHVETKSHLTQARALAQSIRLSSTAAKALAEIALLEYDEGNKTAAHEKLAAAIVEMKAINFPAVKHWEQKLSELR